jgi:hypothetical protein
MKRLVLLFLFIFSANVLLAQTARIQVIHNSADLAADPVDVYLNGDLALEDFAFRNATSFFDVPAETAINIGVAAPNTTVNDTLKNFTFTLAEGETYIAIANGIVSMTGYTPNPVFDIHVFATAREAASQAGNSDVLVYHGSTDAPTVDVTALGAGTIVDNISYSEFQGYLELETADYTLDVQDETGSVTVASFEAPLATLGLADSAMIVFASGFLNPANNSDGPAFGLYVALPNGNVVALPTAPSSIFEQVSLEIPNTYNLNQNYPNPFNPTTKIKFSLPKSEFVILKIYDVAGRLVSTLVEGRQEAGQFEYTFDASQLSSGVYFYRLEAGNFSASKSMMLVK